MENLTITLTDKQRKQILADMNQQIEMLSDQEVEYLATELNNNVNIPFLKEKKEKIILVKLVRKVDRYLYNSIPNELYGCVKNTKDGISDEDADDLKEVLVDKANHAFNIRYLPEPIEKQIFAFLVGLIVNAMRKNMALL
jgi:hypothetical protein